MHQPETSPQGAVVETVEPHLLDDGRTPDGAGGQRAEHVQQLLTGGTDVVRQVHAVRVREVVVLVTDDGAEGDGVAHVGQHLVVGQVVVVVVLSGVAQHQLDRALQGHDHGYDSSHVM